MSESTNTHRSKTEWLFVLISVCVLAVCLYYAFARAFLAPNPGVTINTGWVVTYVDPCDSHPGWCETNPGRLEVGDQLVRIGDLTYDHYRRDRRIVPFAGYAPGESVPVTLRRDGQERTAHWEMPVPTAGDRLTGLAGLLFSLPFWAAGTIGLLFLRPRNRRWRLLVAFYYLAAVWLAAGTASHLGVGASSLTMHAVTWLLAAVCLHLHALVPALILRRRPRHLLPALYAVAAVLALLELFQLLPRSAYSLGLLLAIAGSLGLLAWRLFDRSFRSARPATCLMLASIGLAFGPSLLLALLPNLLGFPAPGDIAITVSLLSIPILPLGYTYAVYKRRLGTLEFRTNRALATYSFVLLYGTLFALVHLLGVQWIGTVANSLAVDIVVSLLFIAAAPSLYTRFRHLVSRLIYGVELDPDEIVHVFTARISATLSLEALGDLLAGEVTRSLFIRQSALYLLEDAEPRLVYASGVELDGAQATLQRLQSSPIRMGEYIPPPVEQSELGDRGGDEFSWVRLAIPLVVREQTIGVWLLGRRDPEDYYSQNDIALLTTLASQVAVAVENIRLFEEAQREIAERRQVEESLRESQRRLSHLMASLPGMAYRCRNDPGWTMNFVSEGCFGLTGYHPADLVASRTIAYGCLIHPDDRQGVWDRAQGALGQHRPFQLSYRIRTSEGQEKWVWEQGSGVFGPQGNLVAVEGFIADVTDRVRAEQQVRREAARAKALARIANQLNAQLEVGVVLDTVCREAALTLDMPAASVYLCDDGSEWLTCASSFGFAPELLDRFPLVPFKFYEDYRKEGTPIIIRDVRAVPGLPGSELLAELDMRTNVSAVMLHEETVLGALNVTSFDSVRDLTEDELAFLQGLADQAAVAMANATLLEQSQQRSAELTMLNRTGQLMSSTLDLATVLETTMRQAVAVLQVETGSILLLDPDSGDLVFEAAYGQAGEALQGRRLPRGCGIASWVAQQGSSVVVPDVQADDRYYSQIDADTGFTTHSMVCVPLVSRGHTIGVVQALNKVGGAFSPEDRRLLEALAGPAANAIENARLYKALDEERTSLARRVEARTAELRVANEELARAARLKDEFLASMSHELRTPLNAILGMSEVLRSEIYGPLDEKQNKSVRVIEESGRHLLNLINDILDVAKIEAGKIELEIRPVSVDAVCRASLQFVRQEALKKRIAVSSTVDTAVTIVEADERRLKQILINLLTNAVKFTPEGGEVGLEAMGDAENQLLHFSVWDTGIGIAREDVERLFKPFVQLDSSLSREYSGTGLGLALVRRLVEMHGGSVMVDSDVGKGSRFTVTLPWRERVAEVSPGRGYPEPEAEDAVLRVPSSRLLILLAEDDEINTDMILGYLEAKGYRVIVAQNGVEAVNRAKEEKPDLVLMDIQMPEVDGLEATQRIRADADREVATIPIVALTALAMTGDEERCLQAGANAYVSKPVSLKSLTQAIETQLMPSRRAADEA
jgi:PAS domain S-box-containing protein